MQQRKDYIDYAKAIGIFLVVLAHTPLKNEVSDWIYVFHMPLFFFLSGVFAKCVDYNELWGRLSENIM